MQHFTVKILVSGLIALAGESDSQQMSLVFPTVEATSLMPSHEAFFAYAEANARESCSDDPLISESSYSSANGGCYRRIGRMKVTIDGTKFRPPVPARFIPRGWSREYVADLSVALDGRATLDPGLMREDLLTPSAVRARAEFPYDREYVCSLVGRSEIDDAWFSAARYEIAAASPAPLADSVMFEIEVEGESLSIWFESLDNNFVDRLDLEPDSNGEVFLYFTNQPFDRRIVEWLRTDPTRLESLGTRFHFDMYSTLLEDRKRLGVSEIPPLTILRPRDGCITPFLTGVDLQRGALGERSEGAGLPAAEGDSSNDQPAGGGAPPGLSDGRLRNCQRCLERERAQLGGNRSGNLLGAMLFASSEEGVRLSGPELERLRAIGPPICPVVKLNHPG